MKSLHLGQILFTSLARSSGNAVDDKCPTDNVTEIVSMARKMRKSDQYSRRGLYSRIYIAVHTTKNYTESISISVNF